jgi:putative ABC transport system permease protein
MHAGDVIRFTLVSLLGQRLRTTLMMLAMVIGVAAVVLLTALGESARHYVTDEFASLGTHLVIVLPGRTETSGAAPSMFVGETPRDLTLDDAASLLRSPAVRRIAPVVVGDAPVAWQGRERDVAVLGSTADLLVIRHWNMAQGHFLPSGDIHRGTAVCVIGAKVKRELFGTRNALGEWVRIGQRRFRVIGVIGSEGRSIGVDVEDLVIVPVAAAQSLFNTSSLFRILAEARSRGEVLQAKNDIIATLRTRHQGEEDVTVITQDAVLATFDRIFRVLTLSVAGIATISLAVAGVLIMNVMLVAVSQRTAEIGLMKALGAPRRQIVTLFLVEAVILSLLGAGAGVAVGGVGCWVIERFYPSLSVQPPWWSVGAALIIALITGLAFGAMPARRAAKLDPVTALARR